MYLSYQALLVISTMISDKSPGEYLKANTGPEDIVVMEAPEEFEFVASLAYYTGRRVLIVQREGLPEFPYPVSSRENYLISPESLQTPWFGPQRVFFLSDNPASQEPFLKEVAGCKTFTGKRLLVNRRPDGRIDTIAQSD
jgi:hypothetical protein